MRLFMYIQARPFSILTGLPLSPGRTLGVVPRQLSPSGYLDLDRDDFDKDTPLDTLQVMASSLVYGVFGASAT